jgi:serine/threonine protein phosphatase 1
LRGLFGQARARIPEGQRVYAIGDIHGCPELLDRLMESIRADEAGAPARSRLVFLGDYVDRGPDSRGVLDRLIALGDERPDAVFLLGNHEAAMLDYLEDPMARDHWIDWGGEATLSSYGIDDATRRDSLETAAELRARLPAEHLSFLNDLRLHETIGDYLFVHAGVRPGAPLEQQAHEDLLWIREEFHRCPSALRPDKVVVHGHHPMRQATDFGWRIAVDSGACFTGRLTAVVLEGETRRFLST